MLETPGCWACDEMGALDAGVFCGVLEQMSAFLATSSREVHRQRTYGAPGTSDFLLRMGSAIFTLRFLYDPSNSAAQFEMARAKDF